MITLDQARERLTSVLAEVSAAFWEVSERNRYINDAQNRIAHITKAIPQYVDVVVDPVVSSSVTLPRPIIGTHAQGIRVEGGRELGPLPAAQLAKVDPNWRNRVGTPRWVSFQPSSRVLQIIPKPTASVTIRGAVATTPQPLTNGNDYLYDNYDYMEPYIVGTIYLAAAYALMKDRDPDVTMFYEFFKQELIDLGIDPDDIPSIQSVIEPGDSR